ncbi:hypothetical protein SO802_017895 [Lithocarpus litseifolius]|uniref:Uncharacterized protein n=1 Tax=Lithocarpus litseifolius TaxID=425828 RepID=A0AAW2CJG3_9ROSI
MVKDLSDLEGHNPHSPTNDSLWEANFLVDTDEEIDPSNAAVNTTMQQTSDQATNRQNQSWDPPKESPDTNMAKTLPEVPKFSNFEIGESSGTTHDNEDTQVIGGTLISMMPGEAHHENISSHNLTGQYGHNIVGNMELSTHIWELSPQHGAAKTKDLPPF